MREIRTSGSEGGGVEYNRRSLPLSTRRGSGGFLRDREIYPNASGAGSSALAEWREPIRSDRLPVLGVEFGQRVWSGIELRLSVAGEAEAGFAGEQPAEE